MVAFHSAMAARGGAGRPAERYRSKRRKGFLLCLGLTGSLFAAAIFAVAAGSYELSPMLVLRVLCGAVGGPEAVVVWTIRLPRIAAAIVSGWGLAIAGLVLQCLLRNPLASPFTLGISHGAAFGASIAIVAFGAAGGTASALYGNGIGRLLVGIAQSVALFAFMGAMATMLIILSLARIKRFSPEAVILAGIALSSLAFSGTTLAQYFATELQIATVVFWAFGDVARSSWREIALTAAGTGAATVFFLLNRWNLNALATGEESARGLGASVEYVRGWGMFWSALVIALITAFHGIIAFLGLLAPHIARRISGGDYGMLIPFTCLVGALLLLLADTAGRLLLGSGSLPVGVLTSFMGAPLFLYLLIRGRSA